MKACVRNAEGSFIAWKKCREGKIVKLLIPEYAERKGNSVYNCRVSEAVVMEIYDKYGNSAVEAVSRYNKEFKYVKGAKQEKTISSLLHFPYGTN